MEKLQIGSVNYYVRDSVDKPILAHYWSNSNLGGLFFWILVFWNRRCCIGYYRNIFTIWSIYATSASKINDELLKNKVEGQLFFLIGVGLTESFVATVLCVFVPYEIPHYAEIMTLFTVLTSVSFVKFIVLIMMTTKVNIK